jgi:hypothetical protein
LRSKYVFKVYLRSKHVQGPQEASSKVSSLFFQNVCEWSILKITFVNGASSKYFLFLFVGACLSGVRRPQRRVQNFFFWSLSFPFYGRKSVLYFLAVDINFVFSFSLREFWNLSMTFCGRNDILYFLAANVFLGFLSVSIVISILQSFFV